MKGRQFLVEVRVLIRVIVSVSVLGKQMFQPKKGVGSRGELKIFTLGK
jgi:hypothetical protein